MTTDELLKEIDALKAKLEDSAYSGAAMRELLTDVLDLGPLIDDETGHWTKAINDVLKPEAGKVFAERMAEAQSDRDRFAKALNEILALPALTITESGAKALDLRRGEKAVEIARKAL